MLEGIGKFFGRFNFIKRRNSAQNIGKNCGIFDVDDGGHAGVSWDISDSHTKQEAWTGYRLSEPTDIQAGKEITLWAKYGYRDSESIGISTSNFRSATCDFGLAVTVKFWGEKVD